MILLLIVIVTTLLLYGGLYKLFEKAGITPWKAFVPYLNYYHWINLVGRPRWWWYVTFIPVVNMVVFLLIRADLANYFGKRKFWEHLLVWIFPFVAFTWWGFSKDVKFTGYSEKEKKMKSAGREWADAIAFAVLAATIIRTFLLEAFTIPTPSLEKSLMVGDFLFVSKVTYGPKIPNTPLAMPFVHHTIPLLGMKSYVEWIKLPHYRLPGIREVENNDIVVFNYPDGDTTLENMQDRSYYNVVRDEAYMEYSRNMDSTKKFNDFLPGAWMKVNNPDNTSIMEERNGRSVPFGNKLARPVDKRENYVKRCVGIAGDKLEIKDRVLYINDKVAYNPPDLQFSYMAAMRLSDCTEFFDSHDITDIQPLWSGPNTIATDSAGNGLYYIHVSQAKFEMLQKSSEVASITPNMRGKGEWDYSIFPHVEHYPWNNDNFGPMQIPKKGMTLEIDANSIPLYERIIDVYEGNDLAVKDGKVFINGAEAKQYTFKMDYFWLMGDNRHNSADSRSWGFVPEDHVVGTPVFIWLSMKDPAYNPVSGTFTFKNIFSTHGKFRWNRMFTFVSKDGLSMSFLLPAVLVFGGFWGYNKWKRKKEGTKNPASRKK